MIVFFFHFCRVLNFHVKNVFMVSGLCNLKLQNFSFHDIQTLHDNCSHIEDVHLLFCAYLINIFS